MKFTEPALLLFSGGQDSSTCLFWAMENFSSVRVLCFDYGQRHSKEIDIARTIAKNAGVDFQLLDTSIIANLSANSLTSGYIEMDKEKPNDSTYPNTFVAGRNLLFLTFAAVIARNHGIRHIVTGVSEADYSGYPDCRDTFILSANTSINLAMDEHFKIHTPLMWKNKAQVWQMADELGVFDLIRYQTLTCYNGIVAEGCGKCPACELRNKGLSDYLSSKTDC